MFATMRNPTSPRTNWVKVFALAVAVAAIAFPLVQYQAGPHSIKPAAAQAQLASPASHELGYMPTPAQIAALWAAMR